MSARCHALKITSVRSLGATKVIEDNLDVLSDGSTADGTMLDVKTVHRIEFCPKTLSDPKPIDRLPRFPIWKLIYFQNTGPDYFIDCCHISQALL
ncbi:MAG: hypothetical protein BGP05_21975 [Rhizobiales bacterium 62-47]|nr:MAG: hypothetical protein BGP05_21975 [Rhizobiales bacterium 62-47]